MPTNINPREGVWSIAAYRIYQKIYKLSATIGNQHNNLYIRFKIKSGGIPKMVQKGLMNGTTDVDTFYPLGMVDDVLEKIGLPKTRPIFNAVSPQNIIGRKLGVPAPGELIEKMLNDIDTKLPSGAGLPKPPGFR